MQAHWIVKMINRPTMGAGIAFAALMALGTLSASTGSQQPLGALVAAEAGSLQAQARELRGLVDSKSDAEHLSSSVAELREKIAGLHATVKGVDTKHFSAEQLEHYQLIHDQIVLMDQIAANKEDMLDDAGAENRRILKYKAVNLVERARLLGKTARSASFFAGNAAE